MDVIMKNKTHKVVILDNFSSPYIQQAIIILKNKQGNEDNILREAEKIVNRYIERNKPSDGDVKIYPKMSKKKRKSYTGIIWGIAISLVLTFILNKCF